MNEPSAKDFTLCWSHKNRTETFRQSIWTAHNCFPKEVEFLLIDGGSTQEHLREIRKFVSYLDRPVRVIESGGNSLPEAWNLGFKFCNTRYIVYSSSDCEFVNYEPDKEKIRANPNVEFISCDLTETFSYYLAEGYQYIMVYNHSVFCVDRAIIPKIGFWEERFGNSPHFDTDFFIRLSEGNIKHKTILFNYFYKHVDADDVVIDRTTNFVPDRLPMNTFEGEDFFKKKWATTWPGWRNYVDQVEKPHPPIHITQVTRLLPEVDWNPSLTNEMRKLYV